MFLPLPLLTFIREDPLAEMTKDEKEMINSFREYCTLYPKALAKYLLAVDWTDRRQTLEVYRLLHLPIQDSLTD